MFVLQAIQYVTLTKYSPFMVDIIFPFRVDTTFVPEHVAVVQYESTSKLVDAGTGEGVGEFGDTHPSWSQYTKLKMGSANDEFSTIAVLAS
jgi:hypothetical protein